MLKLEMIPRRATRTLYKLKFSSIVSISTLMRSLGWLKFRYLCRYRLLCITHKVIHLRSPEYLADLISMHTLSRASRKCHTMKIVQCSTISAHSESAFSAPKYWNSLPYDIRCLKSLSLFKCKLSTHLLKPSISSLNIVTYPPFSFIFIVLYLFYFCFLLVTLIPTT